MENSTKYRIATPFSGDHKFVSLRLPVEIAEFIQTRAEHNISNVTAEIRGMLVDHLRYIGVMPPQNKAVKL